MTFEERMEALARAQEQAKERADREYQQIWQVLTAVGQRLGEHQQLLAEIILRDQENQKAHERAFAEQRREIAKLDRQIQSVTEAVSQLATIAGVHQDRPDNHEERIEDLEK